MGSVILSAVMASVLATNACTSCQPVRALVVAPVRVAVRVAAVPVRVVAVPVRVVVRAATLPVRIVARVRPARRVVGGLLRVRPVRRLLNRRPVRGLLLGRRCGRICCGY